MDDMNLFEAMYSQRSFTRFRPDPVPKEAIEKIIDAAIRAPNGGNRQAWEFIAITDPGSGLERRASTLSFRHTFLNDPDIGGRYSALSLFGLVPARGFLDCLRRRSRIDLWHRRTIGQEMSLWMSRWRRRGVPGRTAL